MYRHELGDIVRLNVGWTPMTVIGFTPADEVIAQYGTCPTEEDVRNPEYARSTYTRPHHRFTQWDGKNQYTKFPKGIKMARQFYVLGSAAMIGSFMQTSTLGHFVLEFPDGLVAAYNPHELEEVTPKTFMVKGITIGGKYSFLNPQGVEFQKNEILLSDNGDMYIIIDVDTKNMSNSLRVFSGSRVQTTRL